MDADQTRFTRSDKFVERAVRGERVLVPLAASMEELDSLYVLNETAALIWEGAAAGQTEAELAARLAAAYEVDPARARRDTRAILDALIELGALHVRT